MGIVTHHYTHILVGAGLHNGLTALALRQHQPDARVLLLERGPRPAGNHTWCFHGVDPDADVRALLGPLVEHTWPRQEVVFPDHRRVVETSYSGFTSASLADQLERAFADWPGSALMCGVTVAEIGPDHVVTEDGRRFTGDLVIDARGPGYQAPTSDAGYQKFYGLDVELEAPHGLDHPLLMDATIPQIEGFRFLYVLPLDDRRCIIEDTRFALTPTLDLQRMRSALLAEIARRGWRVARERREEHGVLPMTWSGGPEPVASPVRAGYAGGWLHPGTGYSLPVAVRFALAVARGGRDQTLERLDALRQDLTRRLPFYQRLNRLLFQCFAPEDMWNVFTRFYRKPEALIERFYALRATPTDRTRILLGRPPRGVNLGRALALLR
ncbi:MAG: lycopene cyclase [Deltaproteobacteria bacterium]|nr:MAG: lycopene cyclase [Deltaproteobacteria bacterium]